MATRRVSSRLALAAVMVALLAAVLATPVSAAIRHIDGTVLSKNARTHSFRISTQSGTFRIRIDAATVFERISGFGGLHRGLAIEVDAKQTRKGLLARQIETRGGGGGDDHGDDDRGGHGADDGPNHD